jgi:hypothetical protein
LLGLVALLIPVLFPLTKYTLRDGLTAALDRLASARIPAWLAEWPGGDQNRTVGTPV